MNLTHWFVAGSTLAHLARWFRAVYGTTGLLVFACLIFCLEGLGLPIPVEVPLGLVGVLMNRGRVGYGEVVLFAWMSTLIGNTAGYLIGYYGGRPLVLRLLSLLRVRHEHFDKVESWFNRYGLWLTVGTRWINWGFAQNIWLMGITQFNFVLFFTVMAVTDLLWAMGWGWIALHFVRHLRRFGHLQRPLVYLMITLMAIGLLVWWAVQRSRRPPEPPAPPPEEADTAESASRPPTGRI